MFSLPQAKRVRREELYSPPSSPQSSPDPELEQLFRDRVQLEFELVTGAETSGEIADNVPEVEHEEEVEFRLFATTSKTNTTGNATRIRIRSPSVDDRPPGLINPERARSYYFRDSLSPEAEEKLRAAAVSGEDVLTRSETSYPGCSLPWRVTTAKAAGTAKSSITIMLPDQSDTAQKKKRKGKKTRIAIRRKLAEDRDKAENEKKAAAEKALADKIKKAKRNREKKIKKRARDKLKVKLVDGQTIKDDVPAETEHTSDEEHSD